MLRQAGVEQLFNQLLRPKLRTFIPDIYKDVSYVLDDDSYAAAELQDTVRKRFVKAWEALIDGYKVRKPNLMSSEFTEHGWRPGYVHRQQLPTLLRPRAGRPRTTMGEVRSVLEIQRSASVPYRST